MSFGITYSSGGEILVKGANYNTSSPQNNSIKVDNFGYQYVVLQLDSIGLAKDGTDSSGVAMPTGGAGIRGWLSGIYNQMSTNNATMTGGNQKVQVTNAAQAATQGITATSGVTVGTAATPIFNGVVNGKTLAIQNLDQQAFLHVGTSTVTTSGPTIGYRINPGGEYVLDVVPGSNITIYGAGTAALTAVTMVVN